METLRRSNPQPEANEGRTSEVQAKAIITGGIIPIARNGKHTSNEAYRKVNTMLRNIVNQTPSDAIESFEDLI